jgi:hypothetical protein
MNPTYIVFTGLMCMQCSNLSCNSSDAGNGVFAAAGDEKNYFSTKDEIVIPDESLSPQEYVTWIQQHMYEAQNEGNLSFELQYKPYDYIACLESGSGQISESVRGVITGELEGFEYFDLRIGIISGGEELLKYQLPDPGAYEKRVKYYAYEFARDISLISASGDTVHPVLFHFERAYDVTSFCTFSLAFPKEQIDYSKKLNISIYDRLFSSRVISFDFEGSNLHQLPKLKTL